MTSAPSHWSAQSCQLVIGNQNTVLSPYIGQEGLGRGVLIHSVVIAEGAHSKRQVHEYVAPAFKIPPEQGCNETLHTYVPYRDTVIDEGHSKLCPQCVQLHMKL